MKAATFGGGGPGVIVYAVTACRGWVGLAIGQLHERESPSKEKSIWQLAQHVHFRDV